MFGSSEIETPRAEPTEQDASTFVVLVNRMERLPDINQHLPSIKDELMRILRDDLVGGRAASGLSELVSLQNRAVGTMEVQAVRLAMAAMKERYSRAGSNHATLKEEFEAMQEMRGDSDWRRMNRALEHATRRG